MCTVRRLHNVLHAPRWCHVAPLFTAFQTRCSRLANGRHPEINIIYFPKFVYNVCTSSVHSVSFGTYLGFHKRANFRWPCTSAQGGGTFVKNFVCHMGAHGPMVLLNTPLCVCIYIYTLCSICAPDSCVHLVACTRYLVHCMLTCVDLHTMPCVQVANVQEPYPFLCARCHSHHACVV